MNGPFLLDTNVLSELVRPKPAAKVVQFVESVQEPWISSLTLHELTYGSERVRDAARRAKLLAWLVAIEARFSGWTVAVDAQVAATAGRMRAAAESRGHVCDPVDSLIAACAVSVGATLATRNLKHFEPFGISVLDPWEG